MKYLFGALLAALLWFPASAQAKDEPFDLRMSLPVDDRITIQETLPNGMRLWIRPHKQPAGKVSMTLHIAAGSIDEHDDQQGLAHYIEHMAFNGTTHFPPDTLVKRFEALGAQFGRDLNAMTSFDVVAYIVNLPDVKPENIDLTLLYLSDVASGMLFTPEEIDKERPVILEELRSRDAPGMRIMKKAIKVLAPGSLVSQRIPSGKEEIIHTAKRPQFQAYYEKWYRPDLATLMIVGDIDAEAIAKAVRARFQGWKRPAAPVIRNDPGIEPITTLRPAVLTDPDLTTASVGFSYVLDKRARRTIGDLRAMTVERLGAYICQQRLTRRMQEGEASYQDAQISVTPFVAGARIASANVDAETKNWLSSFQELLEELRRMHQHGVLPDELDRAKTAFLTAAEQRVDSAGSAPSSAILMRWIQGVSQGREPMSQAQMLGLLQKILPTITAKEVGKRFNEIYSLTQGVVGVTLPADAKASADEQTLVDLATKMNEASVEPPVAEEAVSGLLAKAPTPGTVVSESKHEKLGVTRMELSNGAVVLVKPMPEAKVVSVRIGLYGGLLDETPENRGITSLAGLSMRGERAATRRHTPRQISEYLNDKKVNVGLSSRDLAATVSISGPPDDLESGFELAHVLLSEPKIDEQSFAAAKREFVTMIEGMAKQTGMQVMTNMRRILSGDDHRFVLPTVERIEGFEIEAAQAWLEQVAKAPMEVVFSGKITVERAKELATRYLGSLPKREGTWEALRAKRVFEGTKGPVEREIVVDTSSPAAIVVAGWRGAGKGDAAVRARLLQAGFMLNSRLVSEIREKRGLTYTIVSQYMTTPFEGMDQLALQFTADPAKAADAAKIARDQVLDFREKGPSEQEVASTQMMLSSGLSAQMQLPQFWGQALTRTALEPAGLDGVARFLDEVMKVDGAQVKAAVQSVIQPERFLQIIGKPKVADAPKKEETSEKKGEPAGVK